MPNEKGKRVTAERLVKLFKNTGDLEGVAEVDGLFAEIFTTLDSCQFLRILPTQVDWPDRGYSHTGEEGFYVVSGVLSYHLGQEVVKLSPGDWLWHRSNISHHLVNTGSAVVTLLSAASRHPRGKPSKGTASPLARRDEEPAYLHVPATTWLDRQEIGSASLTTQLVGGRLSGFEIALPFPGSTFDIPVAENPRTHFLSVLSGKVLIQLGGLVDDLAAEQSVAFAVELACTITAEDPARLLWFCIDRSPS